MSEPDAQPHFGPAAMAVPAVLPPTAHRSPQWRRLLRHRGAAAPVLVVAVVAGLVLRPSGPPTVVGGERVDGLSAESPLSAPAPDRLPEAAGIGLPAPGEATGASFRGGAFAGDDTEPAYPPGAGEATVVDPSVVIPPDTRVVSTVTVVPAVAPTALAASGIPAASLDAYRRAESRLATGDAGCRLSWTVVAAIGRVESGHGTFGGAQVGTDGVSRPAIIGIALDGRPGTALIRDTDRGVWDQDTSYDRAVGPMQFIPGTWRSVGADGNGDGVRDPQNIYDAALATAVYLCAGNRDLSTRADLESAIYSYNHSAVYVATVIGLAQQYAAGGVAVIPPANGLPYRPPPRPASPAPLPVLPVAPTAPADGGSVPPGLAPPPLPKPTPAPVRPAPKPSSPGPGKPTAAPTKPASPPAPKPSSPPPTAPAPTTSPAPDTGGPATP